MDRPSSPNVVYLDTQSFVPQRDTTDCYACLDITRSATTLDVKNAFRRLALRLHPDKNGGTAAAYSDFAKVCEAYEILKNRTCLLGPTAICC